MFRFNNLINNVVRSAIVPRMVVAVPRMTQPAIKFTAPIAHRTFSSITLSATFSMMKKPTSSPVVSNFGPMIIRRMSSTMKKRRMKMNKHKLKKRRKALRMNTKASRE